MSLGIAIKGPEGIVLAADSRVTLMAEKFDEEQQIKVTLPAFFDNANKLIQINQLQFVGAVTYGAGAIMTPAPRTAHSFIPEFEDELLKEGVDRLSAEDFANKLGEFFLKQWKAHVAADYQGPPMIFLIGGYDDGAPYGRIFEVNIPFRPEPQEWSEGTFGITWGGQLEYTERLINGFDSQLEKALQEKLELTDDDAKDVINHLKSVLGLKIPYEFLPLQDCVDLSIILIRTTIDLQKKLVGVRGVGGAIDVATITRTDGFQTIQRKGIVGEVT